jgi:hypothetical protein
MIAQMLRRLREWSRPKKHHRFVYRWFKHALELLPFWLVIDLIAANPVVMHWGLFLWMSFAAAAGEHAYFFYGGTEKDYPCIPGKTGPP